MCDERQDVISEEEASEYIPCPNIVDAESDRAEGQENTEEAFAEKPKKNPLSFVFDYLEILVFSVCAVLLIFPAASVFH